MTAIISRLSYEMLRIRMVEERIAEKYGEQKMRCPVHLSIGQEAVAVGVCQALCATDYLISNHRAHAHYLAKGGDLKRMLAEIYGKSTGCCLGRGGSMHLVDLSKGMMGSTPIVGGSIPVGVGLAFAAQLKGEERVTAIFFGEGSTEEGVFAESLNFAALRGLSVLFVCENNYYSVYSPLSVRQPPERSRVGLARAHGIWAEGGDGYAVDAVCALADEAVSRIRAGQGPCFLEFTTYRFREHCGPNVDNTLGYRTLEEAASWENRCPIRALRAQFPQEDLARIQEEIDEAFRFAEESAFGV
jgi:pyruvate dehydrogenase E1 component alpha subunit